jgi:ribose transport system substrate-binding protein
MSKNDQHSGALSRRRLFAVGSAVGAGALLTACTGNSKTDTNSGNQTVNNNAGENTTPGKAIKIGFSAPAADHGWIAAITANATAQAKKFSEVTFIPVAAGKDVTEQRPAVESLIAQKPDVIVLLPHDGAQLTTTGRAAMDAGIPVVNLDREFSDQLAYRLLIKGDNYGMGVAAGQYIGKKLKGKTNAVIAEIAGIDELPLTQDRSKGFRDGLAAYGLKVGPRSAAQFTVASGQEVTSNLLSGNPKIDAIWNHDDDQGVGVLQAMQQANRKEFFMVGGAGSLDAMQHIKAGDSPLECTVTYSPTMASSAISLARLIAQGRKMSELAELQVPKIVVLQSETITKANVDQYLSLGFRS